MMHTFQQFPLELFYEIAIHLPLTKDVLAFTLTNSGIRRALSTPAFFKTRLELRGWDVSAWKDEDNAAQSPGSLKRWMCIDHTYCRTAQLFEEAAVDGYFLTAPESSTHEAVRWGSAQPDSDPEQDNQSFDLRPVFDGDKTVIWLEKLSKVFPLFVTHHCGANISQITQAKYRDVLRAYARVVGDLCVVVRTVAPDGTPEPPHPRIVSSGYSWFERICFSLIALFIQCDPTTIVSIFSNTSFPTGAQYTRAILSITAFGSAADRLPAVIPDASLTLETISELYFNAFFFQATLCVTLHLNAARPGMSEALPLLAPSLPHFDPLTSSSYSYYSYLGEGTPVEEGTPTLTEAASPLHSSIPSPSPAFSHMRPWLRDRLAGTPFTGLSSTTGCAWAGYYTPFGVETHNLSMYLESRFKPLPQHSDATSESIESICMHSFLGEGQESGVRPFTISGECDERTGVVTAIQAFETFQMQWHGVLTPFGIAGTWGPMWDSGEQIGRFWIWPQEWSPTTT